jgi:hypothetical protein
MAKMVLYGGLFVDAAATAATLPGLSEPNSWWFLALLGMLPLAYGIAGTMLTTCVPQK